MRCAARSVIPTFSPMSRRRIPGSCAIETSTRAWLVKSDQFDGSPGCTQDRLGFLDSSVIHRDAEPPHPMTDADPHGEDIDDEAIRVLVRRLSRAHPSGGRVIERAAILAAGTHHAEVVS